MLLSSFLQNVGVNMEKKRKNAEDDFKKRHGMRWLIEKTTDEVKNKTV